MARQNILALMLIDALQDGNANDIHHICNNYNANPSHTLEDGLSPLHYACGMEDEAKSLQFVKYFLESGANPNCFATEHITPLHVAAINGRTECVQLLLKHGANIDCADDANKTPLHYAIEAGKYEIVEILRDAIFLSKYEAGRRRSRRSKLSVSHKNDTTFITNSKATGQCNSSSSAAHIESPSINKHLLHVAQNTAKSALTPNCTHYNYDVTSPYYINITHRRHKPQPKFPPLSSTHIAQDEGELRSSHKPDEKTSALRAEEDNTSEISSITVETSPETQKINVFSLTRDNLEELSRSDKNSQHSRSSLIETWRNKVQLSRARRSILREFDNVDEMIENVLKNDDLNFTNTKLVNKCTDSTETDGDSGACGSGSSTFILDGGGKRSSPVPKVSLGRLIQKIAQAHTAANETFIPTPPKERLSNSRSPGDSSYHTVPGAKDDEKGEKAADTLDVHNESNFIRSPKNNEFYLQMTEAYVHTDDENGLVFYETKLPSNALAAQRTLATPQQKKTDADTTVTSQSTNLTLPLDYETDALRAELTTFGEPPGPITKGTKKLYIKRLVKYKRKTELMQELRKKQESNGSKFSVELFRSVRSLDGFKLISNYLQYEIQSAKYFANNKPTRETREGHLKQSFIYMLIDPRISCNLPGESAFLDKFDVWKRFLESIFYVGKGKSSRPYSHLYAAMKAHSRIHNTQLHEKGRGHNGRKGLSIRKQGFNLDIFGDQSKNSSIKNEKLEKILDIWANGQGVVCLHVFHNITPVEAYTREASIIDALSLSHLTNAKRGDYYGPARNWTMKEKKYLGIALLYKAMHIYLAEGESQLSPSDLI